MVVAIQKGSARDDTSMHLLRYLWFFVSHYDIDITTVHVAGVTNCTTDRLSRQQVIVFLSQSTGGYSPYHVRTLSSLWHHQTWSPNFRQLFSTIAAKV